MRCGYIAAVLHCLLVLRRYKCGLFTTRDRRRSYCDQWRQNLRQLLMPDCFVLSGLDSVTRRALRMDV